MSKVRNKYPKIRIKAVEAYIAAGSIEEIATSFNINPKTLRRWIRWYKEGGKENLNREDIFRRHPRRVDTSIEKKIALLKENNPSLTLIKVQDILNKNGIKISIKGIWRIWKSYDLADCHRKDYPPSEQIKTTQEVEHGLKNAEQALHEGDIKKAARILNALPSCSNQEILRRIPDRFLSLVRKVEKLHLTFEKTPFPEVRQKAKILRERAENKNLLYTAVRAGLIELFASEKIGNPEKQLILTRRLLKRLETENSKNNAEPALHFYLLLEKGLALADLGKTKEVLSCIKRCENLCRYLTEPTFYRSIVSLYSAIAFHKKAHHWIKKSLECTEDRDRGVSYEYLAGNLMMAGDYRAARKAIKGIKADKALLRALAVIISAYCSLGLGKIQDAVRFANKSLLISRKEKILNYFITSTLTIIYCSYALNETNKAIIQLKRLIALINNKGIKDTLFFIKVLLGQSSFPPDAILRPDVKLALLVRQASISSKITDYRKAYNYANSQRLMGLFHRLVLFFPQPVNKLIDKGKPTGLPKALLNLPVFQKKIPVYHMKFLGPSYIYRSSVQLPRDPTPMYVSFLIRLSLKSKIELASVYNNFWSHAKDPRGSLAHFLFGLRKYLRLPPDTLFIKQGFLHFKGYITTDYQEYEETIIRAKALERAGEWTFAKKEYLRTFALFRGEPFRKMYDPWSEHRRRVILNELETEAIHFAKSCLEHKNKVDAKKVLEKVLKIIPQSEEIEKMVRECGSRSGNDL